MRRSHNAILVQFENKATKWIPKSVVDASSFYNRGLVVASWWARKRLPPVPQRRGDKLHFENVACFSVAKGVSKRYPSGVSKELPAASVVRFANGVTWSIPQNAIHPTSQVRARGSRGSLALYDWADRYLPPIPKQPEEVNLFDSEALSDKV